MKLLYEELILGYTDFAVESRLIVDYWDKIFHSYIRDDIFVIAEARGALTSLFFALQQKRSSPSNVNILYEILIFQGDLYRYTKSKNEAMKLYEEATRLVPSAGRAYNQIAVTSTRDTSTALFNFILSLIVASPFVGARDNLRKAIEVMIRKEAPNDFKKVIAFSLKEKMTGKRLQYGRERASVDLLSFCDSFVVHLPWMCLLIDPGFMDTSECSVPVEYTLRLLAHGIKSSASWLMPMLHFASSTLFVNKTKRFLESWDQITSVLVDFSHSNVMSVDNQCKAILLPEDELFRGLPCFTNLPKFDDDHMELFEAHCERIASFMNLLKHQGLLVLEDGKWYTKRQYQKHRTGQLLAKQKLKAEVERLELEAGLGLQSEPWLIPDFDYLLAHWNNSILPSLDRLSRRYIVTFPVLAELDYAKLGPDGVLVRSIIGKLAELTSSNSPCIRLQKTIETIPLTRKPALAPKEAHRHRFSEAVQYYQRISDGSIYKTLTLK